MRRSRPEQCPVSVKRDLADHATSPARDDSVAEGGALSATDAIPALAAGMAEVGRT